MSQIDSMISGALTARQLIEYLKELGEDKLDLPVAFKYIGNDYWHTELAAAADGVGTNVVEYSKYHRCGKVIDEEKLHNYIDEANAARNEDDSEEPELNIRTLMDDLPDHMAEFVTISVSHAY